MCNWCFGQNVLEQFLLVKCFGVCLIIVRELFKDLFFKVLFSYEIRVLILMGISYC